MMQYPIMRGTGKYRVVAAKLNGGLNLSDPPGQVEDNQLTACRNMWWHKGALRTRPGTVLEDSQINSENTKPDKVVRISEQESVLLYYKCVGTYLIEITAYSLCVTEGIRPLGCCTVSTGLTLDGFTVIKRNDLVNPYLILCSNAVNFYATHIGNTGAMVKVEPYIPLVTVERFDETINEYKTVAFETQNILTKSERYTYTSDGVRTQFKLSMRTLPMMFAVEVRVTLQNKYTGGMATFTVQIENVRDNSSGSVHVDEAYRRMENNDYLNVDVDTGTREIDIGFGGLAIQPVSSNNIEVILKIGAYSIPTADKMLEQCAPVWFGGANSGLAGGTRLFVAADSMVYWSEVNKPLYFPENNYAHIGQSDDDVVAMAQQGDQLVIFKKSEIYAMQYVAGNSITLEDVENGADMSTLSATFPLVPIHPTIGCDCPNSIRLVNNRLVWATSDAHVYMMPSLNLYSERNVRDITALIRRELGQHRGDDLKRSMAAEYMGYYMLLIPSGKIILLDTGNSAFQSYAYYSSEKRASRLLPWYTWDIPIGQILASASSSDEVVLLVEQMAGDGATKPLILRFDGEVDRMTEDIQGACTPVPCSFATKVYDFGQLDKLKRVGQVYLSVGSQAGNCVRLTYITERETVEDAYRIEPTETVDSYAPNYLKLYRMLPNVNRTCMFGLRCDSDGAMAVEGIHLNYTMQGDVR